MPLAAYAQWVETPPSAGLSDTAELALEAAWGDPEGSTPLVRVRDRAMISTLEQAEALGHSVASALRAAGARPPVPEA
ncbi:MAG: hypothetical protein ACK40L_05560, partial [Hydrogenophaga sp.]